MAYNFTGMTKRSHLRCFLHGTVEGAPSWSGGLFPSMEQWSFRLCRAVKRQLAMWRCCRGHPSWLKAIVWVVMTGFFNRTVLQFTMPAWQKTSSREITSLLKHPACSPDLNPIENIWGWMASEVYKNAHQFQTVDSLHEAYLHHLEQHSHYPPENTSIKHAESIFWDD